MSVKKLFLDRSLRKSQAKLNKMISHMGSIGFNYEAFRDDLEKKAEHARRRLLRVERPHYETVTKSHFHLARFSPRSTDAIQKAKSVILYLPGGAFIRGSIHTHSHFAQFLCDQTQMPIYMLDYRKHPEASVIDSLNDVIHAFKLILNLGYTANDVVLAGDSAGATLALIATRLLIKQNLKPKKLIAISPVVDLSLSGFSYELNADKDTTFSRPFAEAMVREVFNNLPTQHYDLFNIAQWDNKELFSFPAVFIQVGGNEVLMSDSRRLYSTLHKAGNKVTLRVASTLSHGFQLFYPWLPETHVEFNLLVEFILKETKLVFLPPDFNEQTA